MIGKKLSPVLEEIEEILWELEFKDGNPPEYTIEGFRSATKIMFSCLMDKMWVYQEKLGLSQKEKEEMAVTAGNELRALIKKYTDIDTHKLYGND
jgi:hypothetical protein